MKLKLLAQLLFLLISANLIAQVANQPSPLKLCDDGIQDGITVFDLTVKDFEISGGQTGFGITYYLTASDAENGINSIENPMSFTNASNPQTLFVRLEDFSSGNFDTTSLTIRVLPVPELTQPTPLIACDPDEDGFTQFDLDSKIPEILGGIDPVSYSLTFYETMANAETGVAALLSPYENIIPTSQTVYVKVEDTDFGCFSIVTLELQAINCANTGLIIVDAFLDADGNSTFDADENNFTHGYFTYEVNNDGIVNVVYTSSGRFVLYSENDTDTYDITFSLNDDLENCYDVPVSTFENFSAIAGSSVSLEIPVITNQPCQDLAVSLLPLGTSPRPGFNFTNLILISNIGNETITSGTLEFLYDDLIQFDAVASINPNYTVTNISGGISIGFVDLMPNAIEYIYLTLYCDTTITLGTLVTNTLTATTDGSDIDTSNNMASLSQIVVGSYDPNDIVESHGPKIVYDDFAASDGYLYYTIRFQNIGTAEAINVKIEDILDSQLDESTFQMLRSSHANVVTRTNNELIWNFQDINLPSESMDSEASNGFVYFKIKPQVGYAIGDVIPNVADIYFDFNTAITTNIFNTEFVETLSVNEFETYSFSMYPNPASNELNLEFDKVQNGSITIFDIQGKIILRNAISNEMNIQLDVSAFESGLYFVKMNNGSNETIKKLIIK